MYTLFGMGLFPNPHCHRCFPQNSFTVSHSFCISKAKTNTRTRGGDKNLLSNYSTNEDQLIMTPKYSTAPKKIESLVENFSLFFAVFLLSTAIHSVTDFILQKQQQHLQIFGSRRRDWTGLRSHWSIRDSRPNYFSITRKQQNNKKELFF